MPRPARLIPSLASPKSKKLTATTGEADLRAEENQPYKGLHYNVDDQIGIEAALSSESRRNSVSAVAGAFFKAQTDAEIKADGR